MFNIFKKNKKESEKMSTLEEVRKAYEDLSDDDKKKFHETIQDRIDESLGEQEKDAGTKDSQTAKDREDEALGEEHANGEGDVKELHETDEGEVKHEEEQEAKHEQSVEKDDEHDARLKALESEIKAIKDMLVAQATKNEAKEIEESAKEIYGIGNGVFGVEESSGEKKKVTGSDIKEILNRINR